MTLILTAIVLFMTIIRWLIFIDIIFSWLTLIGINFKPQFISSILEPLYSGIKNIIPTTIGPLDFTPIIVLIFIELLSLFIYGLDHDVGRLMNNFFSIL